MSNAEVNAEVWMLKSNAELYFSIQTQHSALPKAPHRGPEKPAAQVSDCLALLPSGPDAVRRLKLHRFRTAVRCSGPSATVWSHGIHQCTFLPHGGASVGSLEWSPNPDVDASRRTY